MYIIYIYIYIYTCFTIGHHVAAEEVHGPGGRAGRHVHQGEVVLAVDLRRVEQGRTE